MLLNQKGAVERQIYHQQQHQQQPEEKNKARE